MKNILTFIFCFTVLFSINAQTETASDTIIPLERVPIFPGCNKYKDNFDLNKCMSDNFRKFINKKFDASLAEDLDLKSGKHTIKTWFKINKEGVITDVKVDAPHIVLEKETKRVLALFPRMIPGEQEGKKVIVSYHFPIYISILGEEDEKESGLSRKEKRKLLRKAKKILREMD